MRKKDTLKSSLKKCKKAAKTGYKIASAEEKNLRFTLNKAESEIEKTIVEFQNSSCYVPQTMGILEGQLTDIRNSFGQLSVTFSHDLENLQDRLSNFSITLFGRTMAGKSTLMEVLTEGNGDSIGKGGQRTTRDVRSYEWNGLEIIDVPGIGAFEGEEDERLAFDWAKKGDMILFLLSDDGPQPAEAVCMSQIISLGKPVVFVLNIKTSAFEGKNLKSIVKDTERAFEEKRLTDLRNQFLQYAEGYGQDWSAIPFINVQLKLAYMAQNTADKEKEEIYTELSRINDLKKMIQNQVESKGEFFRIKNFVDTITIPVAYSVDSILKQSHINRAEGMTIRSKKEQLADWRNKFIRDSKNQIRSELNAIKADLYDQIANFAEDHFDDNKADVAWDKVLVRRGVVSKCEDLMSSLETACNNKIMEVSKELTYELNFTASVASDKSLNMHKIVDVRRIWEWTHIIVGGGLGIAYLICGIVGVSTGPIGWASLASTVVGIVGSIVLRGKSIKEHRQRVKLEKALRNSVDKMCASLQDEMDKNLDKLIQIRVNNLLRDFETIISTVILLADEQNSLAWELNNHLINLNKRLIEETIQIIEGEGTFHPFSSVARIPGTRVMIAVSPSKVFSAELTDSLFDLIGEKIEYMTAPISNKKMVITQILYGSIDEKRIIVNDLKKVAYVTYVAASADLENRIRIAQQLTGLSIILVKGEQ